MEIQGQIIRIVDKTTVIINLGTSHGITNNSIFSILGNPEPVIDPFTKEELGFVSVVKAKVKAAQVHDKFTIASTRWTSTRLKFEANLGEHLGSLFDREIVDEGELLINPTDLQPWKAKSETPVQIGDTVEVGVDVASASSEQTDIKNSGITKQPEGGDFSSGEIKE